MDGNAELPTKDRRFGRQNQAGPRGGRLATHVLGEGGHARACPGQSRSHVLCLSARRTASRSRCSAAHGHDQPAIRHPQCRGAKPPPHRDPSHAKRNLDIAPPLRHVEPQTPHPENQALQGIPTRTFVRPGDNGQGVREREQQRGRGPMPMEARCTWRAGNLWRQNAHKSRRPQARVRWSGHLTARTTGRLICGPPRDVAQRGADEDLEADLRGHRHRARHTRVGVPRFIVATDGNLRP